MLFVFSSSLFGLLVPPLMIYSHVLFFFSLVLSLTWLPYTNLNYSSRCYLPVTTLWCSFSRNTKTPWFLTVKLLNNGGISEWPTGR